MLSVISSIHIPSPLAMLNLHILSLESICVPLACPAAVTINLEIFALMEIFLLDSTLSGWLSSGMRAIGVGLKTSWVYIPL